jgi:hypothetical protein
MRDHIKILGILNIIMGSLTALIGIVVMLFMGGIASFVAFGAANASSDADNARVAAPFLGLVGVFVAGFLLTISLPAVIGGWGLLKYKSWSRVVMIVISALHLFSIPFGTALGIYGLWVLTNDQSRLLLESGGVMPPQTFPMPQQPIPQPPQAF